MPRFFHSDKEMNEHWTKRTPIRRKNQYSTISAILVMSNDPRDYPNCFMKVSLKMKQVISPSALVTRTLTKC